MPGYVASWNSPSVTMKASLIFSLLACKVSPIMGFKPIRKPSYANKSYLSVQIQYIKSVQAYSNLDILHLNLFSGSGAENLERKDFLFLLIEGNGFAIQNE